MASVNLFGNGNRADHGTRDVTDPLTTLRYITRRWKLGYLSCRIGFASPVMDVGGSRPTEGVGDCWLRSEGRPLNGGTMTEVLSAPLPKSKVKQITAA